MLGYMIVPGNEGLSELPFQESRKVQEFQRESINSSCKTAGGFGVRIGMQANKNSKKLREVKKKLSDLFVRYPYHPCDWWIYLHENHTKITPNVPKYTSFMDGMGYEFVDTRLQKTFLWPVRPTEAKFTTKTNTTFW